MIMLIPVIGASFRPSLSFGILICISRASIVAVLSVFWGCTSAYYPLYISVQNQTAEEVCIQWVSRVPSASSQFEDRDELESSEDTSSSLALKVPPFTTARTRVYGGDAMITWFPQDVSVYYSRSARSMHYTSLYYEGSLGELPEGHGRWNAKTDTYQFVVTQQGLVWLFDCRQPAKVTAERRGPLYSTLAQK